MADELNLGANRTRFDDVARQIRQDSEAGRALDDLRRKEDARRQTEEATVPVEEQNRRVRTGLAGTTQELTGALSANIDALAAETAAIRASTSAMERNLAMRRALGGTPIVTAGAPIAAAEAAAPATAAETERAAAAARQAEAIRRATVLPQAYALRHPERPTIGPEEFRPSLALANQSPYYNFYRGESRFPVLGAQASSQELLLAEAQAALRSRPQIPAVTSTPVIRDFAGGFGGGGSGGRPPSATGGLGGGGDEFRNVSEQGGKNAIALEKMAVAEGAVNREFQASGAVFADASTRLSRHGALTTEFIQALARGEVTLAEFGSQMTATIGKFGGWALAGAAVFGVVDAMRHLLHGATETQAAVSQLGRFIPGLGGPAGGGTSQVGAAQSTVRQISTEFNVPISEVVSVMQVTSRTFHNLNDSANLARAALAAQRLDQVPQAQSEQYLVGITQSLHLPTGQASINVINQLNALQSTLGARVNQTLPALARAAPAAEAAGLSTNTTELLAALGVRAGISGNQVGTALLRSLGTFAFRPSGQLQLREYGINAVPGDAEGLWQQVLKEVTTRRRPDGRAVGQTDLRNLSQALGGPLLGTRTILPILEQAYLDPSVVGRGQNAINHPRPYTEDLAQVLGTASESAKKFGIGLESLGGELAQGGLLTPIISFLDLMAGTTHALGSLLSPLVSLVGVVDHLPRAFQDVLGALLAYRAVNAIAGTRFGGVGQSFIGRLPGLGAIRNEPREVVESTATRYDREVIPQLQSEVERSSGRLLSINSQRVGRQQELTRYLAANSAVGSSEGVAYDPATKQGAAFERDVATRVEAIARLTAQAEAAQTEFTAASEVLANMQGQLQALKNSELSWAQRSAVITEAGATADQETLDLKRLYAERWLAIAQGGTPPPIGAVRGGARAGLADEEQLVAPIAAQSARDIGTVTTQPPLGERVREAGPTFYAGPATAGDARAAEVVAAAAFQSEGADATSRAAVIRAQLKRVPGAAAGVARDPFGALRGGVGAAGDFLSSPTGPFAALIGTQLLGSAIGGGVGSFVTDVGGTAATGALIAQMTGANPLLGLSIGGTLGNIQRTHGSTGTLVGGGIGAAAGFLLGGGPLGAAVGGFLGSTVGGLLDPGDKESAQQKSIDEANKERAATQELIRKAGRNNQSLTQFGGDFAQTLDDAFSGTGQVAQKAQQQVSAVIQGLNAQLSLFGSASVEGRRAAATLATTVSSALDLAQTDPSTASSLLSSIQGSFTNIATRTQREIKYASPAQQQVIAQQAYSQIKTLRDPAQQELESLQGQRKVVVDQLNALKKEQPGYGLNQDSKISDPFGSLRQAGIALGGIPVSSEYGGSQNNNGALIGRLTAGKKSLDERIAATNDLVKQYDAAADDAKQQIAQSVLTSQQQQTSARADLKSARTPDERTQATIALQAAEKHRREVVDNTALSGPDRTQALAKADKEVQAARQGHAQAVINDLTATTAVAENAIPSTDPVGRAVTALNGQTQIYNYMKAHRNVFGATALKTAYSQVEAAQQGVADAEYQQQAELIQAQGALARARTHGDAVGGAHADEQAARNLLAIARTPAQRATATAGIIQAQDAAAEAQRQNTATRYQIAQESDFGNTVAQANDAIAAANAELRSARNTQERLTGQLDLLRAQHQLEQALADRYRALGELAASTTTDPVQQALDRYRGTVNALAHTHGFDSRVQAQTAANQALQSYEQSLIDQRTQAIDFQFQMGQISSSQAAHLLQDVLHMKGITRAQRQQLQEEIKRYNLGLESPIGGDAGGFDLAPGNIRLPTFYDVRQGLRRGGGAAGTSTNNNFHSVVHNRIVVNVHGPAEAEAVYDAIDRATHSHIHHSLRAAGLR